MVQYCEYALRNGVGCICFTDHVDYNKNDYGYGFYEPSAYFEELRRVQDQYSGRLILLSGIEFSEPHVYKKDFEMMCRLPYDFILGSVHWINDFFPSEMLSKGIKLEAAFEKYWEEVLKAVVYGGFDSLAHIDFPKRYFKACLWDQDQMREIFGTMVKNDLSLEINTSSLRKGLIDTMPGRELLEIYEEAGGRNITIGSDSHSIEELGKGYQEAVQMVGLPLVKGVYRKRKFFKDD